MLCIHKDIVRAVDQKRIVALAGLPLGPLNPLKSLFTQLVPKSPYFSKMVPKVPISV